jgi:hypothetical protein
MCAGSSKVRYLRVIISRAQARNKQKYIQILQHLGVPEAFSVVDEVGVGFDGILDVLDASKSSRSGQELLEAGYGISGTVEVFGIASETPRVEVGFQNFRTEIVVLCAGLDKESVLVEESEVVGRDLLIGLVALVREIRESLGSNASAEWGAYSQWQFTRQ